jgi:hypothetical protein
MHHLESGSLNLGQALQRLAWSDDVIQAFADRGWVIGMASTRYLNEVLPMLGIRHFIE